MNHGCRNEGETCYMEHECCSGKCDYTSYKCMATPVATNRPAGPGHCQFCSEYQCNNGCMFDWDTNTCRSSENIKDFAGYLHGGYELEGDYKTATTPV